MEIVLHSDDINLLDFWKKAIGEYVIIENSIDDLYNYKNSLIIINYKPCANICESFIHKLNRKNNKLLILNRVPTLENGKLMLKYGAKGYGNAIMREHFLLSAIETIKDGMIWLYPELTTMFIESISSTTLQKEQKQQYYDKLTDREIEVAKLLKNGEKYNTIANSLNITPRTVKAHAQKIYSKIGVKDKIALALLLK